MFPEINTDIDRLSTINADTAEIKPLGKSFVFNFKTGKHDVIDGRLEECTFVENISQWIEVILRTELNKYKIYTEDETEDFGISIYKYIGQRNIPLIYLSSELKREIEEQLLQHRFIESITNYSTERVNRGLHIQFTVLLKNSETINKEVIIDV